MKTLEEIKASGDVFNLMNTEVMGIQMIAGQIYDRETQIFFTLGFDEDGWEHAAIHVGRGRKTPSWEIMCKAKRVFWRDDEDVVQIHPKASEYFHGFSGMNRDTGTIGGGARISKMEVLHLWRPKNGDWSLLNSTFNTKDDGGSDK